MICEKEHYMSLLQIKSDWPLTEDQKDRLERMVYGNGHFDHELNYEDRTGVVKKAKAIHFRAEPLDDVVRGETRIVGLDDISFRTGHEPHIYIEAEDGEICGWNDCTGVIKSLWHYGMILQDDDGDVWFCGTENSASGELTGDEPLKRISSGTVPIVAMQNGEVLANLPADGEFWLSVEEEPKITSIPWWGKLDPNNPNVRPDAAEDMIALLEKVGSRIAKMKGEIKMEVEL
jgi:hypothetical protein